jgi:hypothetical protein
MVHGFKPGKHVHKLYSYHKVSTNPWFQTMILHEVIVSNHISYFKTITLSSQTMIMVVKPWSWYAQNYMRSVPVFLFLAQATWTGTFKCWHWWFWRPCHLPFPDYSWWFIWLHNVQYVCQSWQSYDEPAKMHGRQPRSAPRHAACANNNIIPLRI